ncbi:Phosphate carrier protein [Nesidiocoris tenuis]|uniref:Phosphate carrier protein n=1 Tax=Nesidiocoris tenuis TaxID=355587 RepID=A0ABN7B3B9_9HEMI|nr:Phosphate carrier protein [Nesidiocoris tenuis]
MFESARDVILKARRKTIRDSEDPSNTPTPQRPPLVPGRNIAAASTSGTSSDVQFGSTKYLLYCSIGGAICCGLTHALIVPLDLVKCRLQVDPKKYKNLITGLKITVAEDGKLGMLKGWAPTLIGYSLQGTFKFGLYEYFKILYPSFLSEENAYLWRTTVYLMASASAELFADVFLAPFESIKVKIQTTPGFANTLMEAAPKMYAEEGWNAFYKSLPPLWMRQIPYTMMKFSSFEKTIELMYKKVVPKPKEECSKGQQLLVTFVSGYIAGLFCAVVSHPADTLVSKLNQHKNKSAMEVAKDIGFAGMWSGLGPRILMVGTLTALQWFIYDFVKVVMKIPRPPPPEMPDSLKKK